MKRKKGFTLIEIIVVIVIIAILSLILTPSVIGYITNTKESVCNTNFRTIETEYLASSITDTTITLEDIINGYNSNQICSLCDSIEVVTTDDGIEIISCPSNTSLEIDNTNLILDGFINNLSACSAINNKYSKECIENYLGGVKYYNDSKIRSSLLDLYGGSWPIYNSDVLTQINSILAADKNTSIQFDSDSYYKANDGEYYMQTKFLKQNDDGSIDYFNYLSTKETNNEWATNLIHDPKTDTYYFYEEGTFSYRPDEYDKLNIASYNQKTNYDDFILALENTPGITKIKLNLQ
jgi:prepilin-type N-terminal cleavage/methylation domain-containing protein